MRQSSGQKKTVKSDTGERAGWQLPWKKMICLGLMILTMAAILLMEWDDTASFHLVNNESLSYVKGRVTAVETEDLEADTLETDREVGLQQLQVEIQEGSHRGETVEVTNYVTRTLNVVAEEGQTIIICVDEPENAEVYYTVYNYDRTPALVFTAGAFVLIVLLVGRAAGAWSLLGLGYTVFVVLFFMVEAIFHGWSAILSVILTVVLGTLASLILLGDVGKKTFVAVVSTLLGVALSGVLFWIFCALLHISGYNDDSAESLLLIGQNTGMNLRPLLMVAVLIAALGAVMDVGMSLASSLEEIHRLNPELGARALMASGMRIGRDMIGTMTNTLIMAYTGSALTTMLLLLGYGYSASYLLNSDYLAMELAEGIASTSGVVLTVPVASAISAAVYLGHFRKKKPEAAAKKPALKSARNR